MAMILAYQGTVTKEQTLAGLAEHRRLDQIVQGTYFRDSKGCAVGCLTHDPSGGHGQFPDRWGIPEQLAYLIDHIFESLDTPLAVEWPQRIMAAIPVGADLSRVWDQWSTWMLRRLIRKSTVALPEVEVMASLFERAGSGHEPSTTEWSGAAEAAWAARAAEAAEAAEAARAAWAARAAEAAWAAWAAEAAWAAWAAEAAGAAEAARAAARHEWAVAAADELVRLVEAA